MNRRSLMRAIKAVMMRLPGMITCRQFEDFIVGYLEGTLPDRQRKLFEFHLKTCRECNEYLAAYKASLNAAKQGMTACESVDLPEVPEDLVAAVISSRE